MAFAGWGGQEERELHGMLQAAAATLHAEMRAGRRGEIAGVLATLEEAAEHFAPEERRMRLTGFPRLEAHCARHRAFAEEVAAFQATLDRDGPTASLLIEVSQWLSSWLREHVRGEDVEFARFADAAAPARSR